MITIRKSMFEGCLIFKVDTGWIYFDDFYTIGTELTLKRDGIVVAKIGMIEPKLKRFRQMYKELQ